MVQYKFYLFITHLAVFGAHLLWTNGQSLAGHDVKRQVS